MATTEACARVYRYGLLPPSEADEARIRDQLRLAHRYRNVLTEIERQRRARLRAAIAAAGARDPDPLRAELASLTDQIVAARAAIKEQRKTSRSRSEEAPARQHVRDLGARAKELRAQIRANRETMARDPVVTAEFDAANADANARVKEERARCGVYWGTYLLLEDAADRARKAPLWRAGKESDPRFQRFTGEGRLGVQLQGGLEVERVFAGSDTRLQIDPVPREACESPVRGERRRLSRTRVRVRVGSDGRSPIWAEWPMIMHRPLPADGRIKWAYVTRTRVGTRTRDDLCIVVESPAAFREPVGTGVVALDVGWRRRPDGLRVAYFADDGGNHAELVMDPSVESALSRVESLRSIRDRHLDALRPALAEWLRARELPSWLAERTATLGQWRSAGRFAALARAWREQRFDGDSEGYDLLEAWRYRDHHLYDWESHLRRKALGRRREQYRVFAAMLAQRYAAVVLEEFDLRRVARHAAVESEDAEIAATRSARQRASVSELRGAIANACSTRGTRLVVIGSAYTTQTCHACGSVEKFDALTYVHHACSACGKVWDQDHNAALNLLALGRERLAGSGDSETARRAIRDGDDSVGAAGAIASGAQTEDRSQPGQQLPDIIG